MLLKRAAESWSLSPARKSTSIWASQSSVPTSRPRSGDIVKAPSQSSIERKRNYCENVPRKTNGALPDNSRSSAVDGGNIRRGQSWAVNKNRVQLTKTMASQIRCTFGFHTASELLGNLSKLTLLRQSDENPGALTDLVNLACGRSGKVLEKQRTRRLETHQAAGHIDATNRDPQIAGPADSAYQSRPTVRNECGPPRRQGEPFLPHATRAATSFRDHAVCVSSKSSSTHFTGGWGTLRR